MPVIYEKPMKEPEQPAPVREWKKPKSEMSERERDMVREIEQKYYTEH